MGDLLATVIQLLIVLTPVALLLLVLGLPIAAAILLWRLLRRDRSVDDPDGRGGA